MVEIAGGQMLGIVPVIGLLLQQLNVAQIYQAEQESVADEQETEHAPVDTFCR